MPLLFCPSTLYTNIPTTLYYIPRTPTRRTGPGTVVQSASCRCRPTFFPTHVMALELVCGVLGGFVRFPAPGAPRPGRVRCRWFAAAPVSLVAEPARESQGEMSCYAVQLEQNALRPSLLGLPAAFKGNVLQNQRAPATRTQGSPATKSGAELQFGGQSGTASTKTISLRWIGALMAKRPFAHSVRLRLFVVNSRAVLAHILTLRDLARQPAPVAGSHMTLKMVSDMY